MPEESQGKLLFCIKNNEQSPNLLKGRFLMMCAGGLCWGTLRDVFEDWTGDATKLQTFSTPEEARRFMGKHSRICGPQSLVCKMTFEPNGVTIEPLTAAAKVA